MLWTKTDKTFIPVEAPGESCEKLLRFYPYINGWANEPVLN